ncbi:MAG: mobilization protein [Raoultibacter sp.]
MTIGFRVTPEFNRVLDLMVAASGMTKQDYITAKLSNTEINVRTNVRIQKALKGSMTDVYRELRRIRKAGDMDEELAAVVKTLSKIFIDLQDDAVVSDIEQEHSAIFGMNRG